MTPFNNVLLTARAERLRLTMRELNVPALLVLDPVNILYASGAQNMMPFSTRTPARYLLVFAEGPTLLFDYFGCEHLSAELPTIDQTLPALGLCYVSSGADVEAASRQLAAQIVSIYAEQLGEVGTLAIDRFPMAVVDALRQLGFRLSDADAVFSQARRIKMDVELDVIREAIRRVETAVVAMEAAIVPGATENAIWGEFQREFIAGEGQYITTRLAQSGPRTFPYFQQCSARKIEQGDLFCLDTDALGYQGYAVDFSRSFVCGRDSASGEQKELYAKAKDQLDHNIELFAVGRNYREIAEKAWAVPEQHQDSRYYCIAHGLGMSGEYPNIPHLQTGVDYPLDGHVEGGMIFCVESYIGSESSGQGVKLEDQLLITETGVERLSQYPFDPRF
ncbi:MAG: Xaa-Pro dipeptidase [Planctomycetota bacterium]|jgi:Xaa-Pro dipeptidase